MQSVLQRLIIIAVLWSTACQASLFMNEEESRKMKNFVNQVGRSPKHSQEQQNLDISGIMYVDELHWTVWINGVPYHQAGQYDDLSIDSVTENEVTVTKQDGTTVVMAVSSNCYEDNNARTAKE